MTRLAFAFGAGLLAPVNPCGFAMLPAFLGYYVGGASPGEDTRSPSLLARLTQGFGVGAAVSAGFAGVFALAALVVLAGLRPLVRYMPWAAVAIGVGLAALGLALVAGRHVGVRVGERLRPGQDRTYRRMAVFGAAYALASLSCTLAVLLAVVAQALATASLWGMAGVLVAYGAGAATVLTLLSVSAAVAKGAVAGTFRRALPAAERVGGVLLVASGIYLIAYWLPVLTGSVPGRSVASISQGLSGRLGAFLDANLGVLAVGAVVLLGAGTVVAVRSRRARRTLEADSATGSCQDAAGKEAGADLEPGEEQRGGHIAELERAGNAQGVDDGGDTSVTTLPHPSRALTLDRQDAESADPRHGK